MGRGGYDKTHVPRELMKEIADINGAQSAGDGNTIRGEATGPTDNGTAHEPMQEQKGIKGVGKEDMGKKTN